VFTKDERRALFFLAAVAVAGGLIRAVRPAVPAVAAAVVAPGLAGQDLVRQASLSRRAEAIARPLSPQERIDVDQAAADELERLPGVGKRLARRIVADREANGPFGSLAGLSRVAGLSARLLRGLAPHVTFNGIQPAATAPGSAFPRSAVPASGVAGGAVGAGGAGGVPGGKPACAPAVSLNGATAEELDCLPGIGPALAQRIVADRKEHGAFRDVADLARVPGIGPVRIAGLRGRVTIP
jgi:competence ComEA-like helix-hairpin-helix protein